MDNVLQETQEKKTGFWRITFRSQTLEREGSLNLVLFGQELEQLQKCCGRLWVWHVKHLNSVQERFLPLTKGKK